MKNQDRKSRFVQSAARAASEPRVAQPEERPLAEELPSAETMQRIRDRIASESTSTKLTVVQDIFARLSS